MKSSNHRYIVNTIRRYSSWVLCGAASIVLVVLRAQAAPITPTADMHIKPVLCVRGTSAEQCRLDVSITWRGNNTGEYCLYSDKSQQPLRCWTQQAQGDAKDSVSISEDLDYWLAWQLSNDELARKTLKVLTAKSDDRRRARRRRNVWSVF